MLYHANFSYFDAITARECYCFLPCVCEADSPNDAVDKFRDMLINLRKNTDVIEGAHTVYLESLVELPENPFDAVPCTLSKVFNYNDMLNTITESLPAPNSVGTSYAYVDENDVLHDHFDHEDVDIDNIEWDPQDATQNLDESYMMEISEVAFIMFDADGTPF